MNILKHVSLFLLLSLSLLSCKEEKTTEKTNAADIKAGTVVQKPQDLKKVAIAIQGMTCEIGCAKTIESKLSKTFGITDSKVLFEQNVGEFVYDANQISEAQIAQKIAGIGNGEMYTTSEIKQIEL
jgi:periplasmic mercuric ion binding protein